MYTSVRNAQNIESMTNDRAQEAVAALETAKHVLSAAATSLARAGDDDGAFYANELTHIIGELRTHQGDITRNAD